MAEPDPSGVFELSGGAVCLDFANTVDGRGRETPTDNFRTYADVVVWAELAGLVTSKEAGRLRREAEQSPRKAQRALTQARSVREALFDLFAAAARGQKTPRKAMATLNETTPRALAHLRLEPTQDGYVRTFSSPPDDLDRVLPPVVLSALDLLTGSELDRIRVCASDTCDWLFLDRSKNRSRRWCDMQVCGNRAKAHRHYQKKRETS